MHADWPNLRVIQLLFLTDHSYSPELERPSVGSVPVEDTASGRLSPIPEEHGTPTSSAAASEVDSLESLASYLSHDDPVLQSCLNDTMLDSNTPLVDMQPEPELEVGFDQMPLPLL